MGDKPEKCEIVESSAMGKKFWYCRTCKKEAKSQYTCGPMLEEWPILEAGPVPYCKPIPFKPTLNMGAGFPAFTFRCSDFYREMLKRRIPRE